MPDQPQSEYNQLSFKGGMVLLTDDTRLEPNQYRLGINLTNRFDQLDEILSSQKDVAVPKGVKQELLTFGNYIILFVGGYAYYRHYLSEGWKVINGFKMSSSTPRLWTCPIPVSTTNYVRYAAVTQVTGTTGSNANGVISLNNVEGAEQGNLPGLLVQDNINQPYFIFLDVNSVPTARVTQTFAQWKMVFTDLANVTIAVVNGVTQDFREYVPIGNTMAFVDGILFIASQDGNFIYRSVEGRPLDFVVNVNNAIATVGADGFYTQLGGGDATTTSYSVGVGGIACLRALSATGLFVAASNANFVVTKNTSNIAPKIYGEFTFVRTFLFNATCLSDRVIFDSVGDTRFIDLTGVRSFNAVEQFNNEGRNSVFTSSIQAAFKGITQDASLSAGILYDNYELYAMETIFGPAIAKFDTVNGCWTSFDVGQTGGKRIKILAKIELTVQRLYAVTEDDELYTLYIGPELATASVRTIGVCSNILYGNNNIKMNNPKSEIQLRNTRVVINNITKNANCTFTPYVDNRMSSCGPQVKPITYRPNVTISTDPYALPDVGTQLSNLLFQTEDCEQGWKMFGVFTWQGGSVTQFSFELMNLLPQNPLSSQ